ncbi:MBL fold metallo-hydrolase [Actinocatenispora rupis]|uniref:MBL fold metallo-hydrolase n=1 Tax=Actinocatenispora rupis TaxID=519421 RepID=A0A8J3J094_9ACTN|nr:MBL fold metallo-hydrolase [Actinocatenispora rupis]GID13406.1 MBL fold metallo-hydrolase [Actinocatenispora rupis]
MAQGTNRAVSRRRLLAGSVAGAAGLAGVAAAGSATRTPRTVSDTRPAAAGGVRLRWLGNNGWEIRFDTSNGTRTVLIDPWLTRFHTGTYSTAGADPNTPITVDTATIDRYALKADHILVTHGHYDHMTDVPYLASRTGATVLGTESHVNMMRALGAPADQLSVVRGGEYLECDGYTIRVLRSLHSMTGPRAQVPFPGTRPGAPPRRPRVISDLVEGETLAYLVTVGDVGVVDFGGSNFSAADLAGVRPTVALVPAGGGSIHSYVPRLLDALGHPGLVLPTHWDDFDYPLDQPARDWGGLSTLHSAVTAASPDARFTVLDHLETITV